MRNNFRGYVHKGIKVLREEGLDSAMRKAWNVLITPIRIKIDQALTRFFAPFATRWFHKLHYYSFFSDMVGTNKHMFWLGATTSKSPLDSWIYQEIIWEQKPDIIIETGTDRGGSALFFASLFDLIGKGEVITIDITDYSKDVSHSRIKKIHASSIAPNVFEAVKKEVEGKKVMVVLDSDHTRDHVLKEMELYGQLVSLGYYMVVEDGNINGHPVLPGWGPGPLEAINRFMKTHQEFEIDVSREKFGVTFFPKGFLKKKHM